MIGYDTCPYCEKETELYYEGIEQGNQVDMECTKCGNEVYYNQGKGWYWAGLENISSLDVDIEVIEK